MTDTKRAVRNREAMTAERFFDIMNLPCFLYVYAESAEDMQDFWTGLSGREITVL